MGKRKWRRIKPGDLADPATQRSLLAIMDQAKGQPEPDAPEKRPPESPQERR